MSRDMFSEENLIRCVKNIEKHFITVYKYVDKIFFLCPTRVNRALYVFIPPIRIHIFSAFPFDDGP